MTRTWFISAAMLALLVPAPAWGQEIRPGSIRAIDLPPAPNLSTLQPVEVERFRGFVCGITYSRVGNVVIAMNRRPTCDTNAWVQVLLRGDGCQGCYSEPAVLELFRQLSEARRDGRIVEVVYRKDKQEVETVSFLIVP